MVWPFFGSHTWHHVALDRSFRKVLVIKGGWFPYQLRLTSSATVKQGRHDHNRDLLPARCISAIRWGSLRYGPSSLEKMWHDSRTLGMWISWSKPFEILPTVGVRWNRSKFRSKSIGNPRSISLSTRPSFGASWVCVAGRLPPDPANRKQNLQTSHI